MGADHQHRSATVDQVLDRFRAVGGRVTSARRAIVTVVLSGDTHQHLTADEIGRRVQTEHPDLALSTVYRSLDALTELGVLEHMHVGHGPAVYHLVEEAHLHLLCTVCGTVLEVEPAALDPFAADILERTGFRMDRLHSAIAGTCADCSGNDAVTIAEHR